MGRRPFILMGVPEAPFHLWDGEVLPGGVGCVNVAGDKTFVLNDQRNPYLVWGTYIGKNPLGDQTLFVFICNQVSGSDTRIGINTGDVMGVVMVPLEPRARIVGIEIGERSVERLDHVGNKTYRVIRTVPSGSGWCKKGEGTSIADPGNKSAM